MNQFDMKDVIKHLLFWLLLSGLSIYLAFHEHYLLISCMAIGLSFLIAIYLLKLSFPKSKFLKRFKTTNESAFENFQMMFHDIGIFQYHKDGFTMKTPEGEKTIKWMDIETIFGYKLTKHATDTIWIDVFYENGKSFKISEDIRGWDQFNERAKVMFPQIERSWDIDIMHPIYETKLTLVYSRENKTFAEAVKIHYMDSE